MLNDLMLLLAVGLLLLAHVMRSARWALLFPPHYLAQRFNLLLGLAVGYAVDLIVPFRLGEVVRAGLVCRRDGVRFSYVAGTVVVERMTDLVVVSAIIAAILAVQGPAYGMFWMVPAVMAGSALLTVLAALLIRRSLTVRRMVWGFASVFNNRLGVAIADFFWSFAEIIASSTVLRWRYVAGSMAMWALYLSAYAVFGHAIGVPVVDVLQSMLGAPLTALVQRMPDDMGAYAWQMLVFAAAPILIIIVYGYARDVRILPPAINVVRQRGKSGVGSPFAVRNRFKAAATYEQFLAALFSGSDHVVTGFGLDAIGDCIVHKFFNGGSDAITALVEVDSQPMIRKFAVGGGAGKLKVQGSWLCRHGNADLPLVRVLGDRKTPSLYSYDMPMVTPANDFYDVIHTLPRVQSSALLTRVVDRIDAFHQLTGVQEAEAGAIDAYLDVKAARNAQLIEDFAREMIGSEAFDINGMPYGFSGWRRLSDPAWLHGQIRDRRTAVIHGDLTIENIIIAPNNPLGFYIIDPNPENLFDSPLIDWAKLMQSLHLGYETLNRGLSCNLTDGVIRLSSARSHAYADLHGLLETEISARFGQNALREVYFHEIINYLRLTTYKIRQSPIRGLGFFACTNILLGRYVERWG